MAVQHYGANSYYELGRIYPRSRLRENWWNRDRRRLLYRALIPSVTQVALPVFKTKDPGRTFTTLDPGRLFATKDFGRIAGGGTP